MLLFHWGIDGFVTLHKKWKTELPKAALVLIRGGIWVPSEVLLAFVKQMKTLLDRQLLAGQSLTVRKVKCSNCFSGTSQQGHCAPVEHWRAYSKIPCLQRSQETRNRKPQEPPGQRYGRLITRDLPGNEFPAGQFFHRDPTSWEPRKLFVLFISKAQGSRRDVLLEMLDRGSPWDGQHDGGSPQEPGQRYLCRARVMCLRDSVEHLAGNLPAPSGNQE